MPHEKFHYGTLSEVRETASKLREWLPLSENVAALQAALPIGGGRALQNRIVIQPMEGSDGEPDGTPGPLTVRRYERFARGGAALIWFEAVATAPEARASARQLHMTEENLPAFQRLVERIREIGLRENGFTPVVVMQATHSGRYSKPDGTPAPIIAYNNPLFEKDAPIDASRIVTDCALRRYEACYETAARLAQRAGFDGIDVKACHRYLACELLSAYLRPGEYGGSFENRSRFLLNCARAAKSAARGDFFVTSRMNAYDGYPYPYGFGVAPDGGLTPDLSEPILLAKTFVALTGAPMLNITIGNPYTNPHVNRPHDVGNYVPEEHPFTGLSRMMRCVAAVQRAMPDVPVVASALSYLRQFSPALAAGMVEGGHAALAGFGRLAFADPDFPNELRRRGEIDADKACVTCGLCARLLRAGGPSGCALRDREVYGRGNVT